MNLTRMMAAAHMNGAPAGYAWLVFGRASGCTSACTPEGSWPSRTEDPIERGTGPWLMRGSPVSSDTVRRDGSCRGFQAARRCLLNPPMWGLARFGETVNGPRSGADREGVVR
jgi:hypothetical protein